MDDINYIEELIKTMIDEKITIATMESCTSGALISAITNNEGASAITQGGYVTYSNKAKIAMGVPEDVITKHGVYSPKTAVEMAHACKRLNESVIGIGVTGTLSNADPNNSDSIPGIVHICITINNDDYTFMVNAPIIKRPEQKEYIVNAILYTLYGLLNHAEKG